MKRRQEKERDTSLPALDPRCFIRKGNRPRAMSATFERELPVAVRADGVEEFLKGLGKDVLRAKRASLLAKPRRVKPIVPITSPPTVAPAVFTYYTHLRDGSINASIDVDWLEAARRAYFISEIFYTNQLCDGCDTCLMKMKAAETLYDKKMVSLCAVKQSACACSICFRNFLFHSLRSAVLATTPASTPFVVTLAPGVQVFFKNIEL